MSIRLLLIALFIASVTTSTACAQGGCVKDSFGQVICAPPGGGAQINSFGQVVCGPGQCAVNSFGQVICSSQPGGGAMINNFGQVVCVGSCVQAAPSYCQTPR
jgi:hypothetical protein